MKLIFIYYQNSEASENNKTMPSSGKTEVFSCSKRHDHSLYRRCWHIVCVNSKALEICNINENNAGEEGVDIDENTGQPTGVLRENAIGLLSNLMKMEDSKDEKLKYVHG